MNRTQLHDRLCLGELGLAAAMRRLGAIVLAGLVILTSVTGISNAGANVLNVSAAVSNGYDLFASADDIVVPAGGSVRMAGTGGANVDGTHKALTLVGTGTQASAWTLVLA